MARRPDTVIFDLDGVLVDSEVLSSETLIAELAEIGIDVTPDRVRRDFLGRSFPIVAEGLRRSARGAFPDDFETRYRSRLFKAFETRLRTTPGLDDILARLAVPARVATSSTPVRARRAMEICGLWDRFGAHLDTASEVPKGKPEPDLFLLSASRAGLPPERCLVIEDSAPGMIAAEAAGIPSILYLGGGHHRGARWDGPRPSVGMLESWEGLGDMVPGILEDRP
jgi:HAD superfamily hydrolase (TIGR01509 family)